MSLYLLYCDDNRQTLTARADSVMSTQTPSQHIMRRPQAATCPKEVRPCKVARERLGSPNVACICERSAHRGGEREAGREGKERADQAPSLEKETRADSSVKKSKNGFDRDASVGFDFSSVHLLL